MVLQVYGMESQEKKILKEFYRKCALVYMVLVVLEQVKDRVTYVAHHTPFQAAEGFCYIYIWAFHWQDRTEKFLGRQNIFMS